MTTIRRVLMGTEALTFFIGSALHLGMEVLQLREPRIVPASIVEALCGAALVAALLTERRRGTAITLAAHGVAIAGVLLGMAALAAGAGPSTPLNTVYHRVILGALLVTGALAWREHCRVSPAP